MATKTKGSFRESVSQTWQSAKSSAKQAYNSAKNYGSKYASDIRQAYDVGYSRGWDDAYTIPKRFGSKTAASFGYNKGIKSHWNTDKYAKQYERKGKK